MILKIVKDRLNAKVEVPDNALFLDLATIIEDKFKSNGLTFDVLLGYPPKVITGTGEELLTSLGVKTGSLITLHDNARKKEVFEGLTSMGFTAVIIGRAFSRLDSNTLTLDEAVDTCVQLCSSDEYIVPEVPRQKVVRRIIDADNSCLFNAIGFSLSGGEKNFSSFSPMKYRKVIADAVLQDPLTYTEDMLDKPPQEYASWIVNPDKWGGEIELYILAQHLQVEIVAVDIRTGNFLTYGNAANFSSDAALPTTLATHSVGDCSTEPTPKPQGQGNRVYVLYDGVHYDAVTRAKGPGLHCPEECLFNSSDVETLEEVKELARTLRESKQFINLSTGGLECKICFARLDGESAAVQHAKNTGHQNFGQV